MPNLGRGIPPSVNFPRNWMVVIVQNAVPSCYLKNNPVGVNLMDFNICNIHNNLNRIFNPIYIIQKSPYKSHLFRRFCEALVRYGQQHGIPQMRMPSRVENFEETSLLVIRGLISFRAKFGIY